MNAFGVGSDCSVSDVIAAMLLPNPRKDGKIFKVYALA